MEVVCDHIFGDCLLSNNNQFLGVTFTRRFYRKCGLCDVRRIYSKMSQCKRCKMYVHKKCFFVYFCKGNENTETMVTSPRRGDKNSSKTRILQDKGAGDVDQTVDRRAVPLSESGLPAVCRAPTRPGKSSSDGSRAPTVFDGKSSADQRTRPVERTSPGGVMRTVETSPRSSRLVRRRLRRQGTRDVSVGRSSSASSEWSVGEVKMVVEDGGGRTTEALLDGHKSAVPPIVPSLSSFVDVQTRETSAADPWWSSSSSSEWSIGEVRMFVEDDGGRTTEALLDGRKSVASSSFVRVQSPTRCSSCTRLTSADVVVPPRSVCSTVGRSEVRETSETSAHLSRSSSASSIWSIGEVRMFVEDGGSRSTTEAPVNPAWQTHISSHEDEICEEGGAGVKNSINM